MSMPNQPSGSPSRTASRSSTAPLWIVIALLSAILMVLLIVLAIVLTRPAAFSAQAPASIPVAAAPTQDPSQALEPVGTPYIVPAGRSPLPQPGENFERALPAQERSPRSTSRNTAPSATPATPQPPAVAPPPANATPAGVLTPEQAGQFVGQTVTIEGKVVDTYFSTKDQVCFLNFRNDRQGFYVIIFKDVLNAWPQAPHLHFRDKTIRVTGKIFQRGDRTQIRVNEVKQIQIMN